MSGLINAGIENDAGNASVSADEVVTAVQVSLPKTGGTMTGVIAGFESTGIDDNATSTAVTIDASENVLVGKTATGFGTQGVELGGADGKIFLTRNNNSLYLNRLSTDGNLAQFYKDSSLVGSIGTVNGDMYLGTTNGSNQCYLTFAYGGAAIIPANASGTTNDNALDLGHTNSRFDDIYATNGTVQTSDRNEKQDIQAITEAETNVAVACKGLLRSFRWKDSVEKKGDSARTHFGIIAQDLQDAFEVEGLDAGKYSMFISTTWWEKDREVEAVIGVDAVAATYDEERNELSPAVDAVDAADAYIVTDTFDTLEEGATERTRMGVRYSELLAFIIAAI